MCAAVDVFHFVIAQVFLVDTVKAFDVDISLVLEQCPVKRGSCLNSEAVGSGIANGLGDGSGIPGYLLGDASKCLSVLSFV